MKYNVVIWLHSPHKLVSSYCFNQALWFVPSVIQGFQGLVNLPKFAISSSVNFFFLATLEISIFFLF